MPLALSLHIAFLCIWSATLVYMPHLFVRHAHAGDAENRARIEHMQRSLYTWAMTPSALFTVLFGIWLVFERGFAGGWLPVKLALVVLMGLFHVYCGHLMMKRRNAPTQHPGFYRLLPVAPVALIVTIVTLVTAKPF